MTRRIDKIGDNQSPINQLLGDGKVALGGTLGVILSVGVWLVYGSALSTLSSGELSQFIPALVALLVAVTSVVISYNAFMEQRLARQAGTDPVILVHLGNRPDAPVLSTLEVENVGAGAALEVKVEFVSDLSPYVPERIVTDFNAKLHPISAIPNGRSKSFNFGLGHRLLGDEPIPPLEVVVIYKNIEGEEYRSTQIIDVRELHGQRAETPLEAKRTSSLEKIEKHLSTLSSNNNPIFVVSQSIDEYRENQLAERKEIEEWLASQRQEDN